jgi:hypothetical protein
MEVLWQAGIHTIWIERQEPVLLLLVGVDIDQVRFPAKAVFGTKLLEQYLHLFAVGRILCQEMHCLNPNQSRNSGVEVVAQLGSLGRPVIRTRLSVKHDGVCELKMTSMFNNV